MPILASESVETTSNDLHEEQTSVQIKDVKDGNTFLVFDFKNLNIF
jgi:hypothetical protein